MDDERFDRETFGQRLREARDELGATQEEVAEAADLSVEFYRSLERGVKSPSLVTLCALCEELDVSADVLLGLEPRRRPGRG